MQIADMERLDQYLAAINKVLLWSVVVILPMQYNALLNVGPFWLVGVAVGWSILHGVRAYIYLRERTSPALTILLTALLAVLMLTFGYLTIN